MLYDITPSISESLAVWPGDTPPSREVLLDMQKGDSLTLSTLRATVHLGAHADAPSHYGKDACPIDRQPLETYLGPCLVVKVNVPRGVCVDIDAWESGLHALRAEGDPVESCAPRVLLATGTFPDPNQFNEDFAAISPELIDHLHGQGVQLVGIDTPSVDLFESKELPAHRRVLRQKMAILEGLVLAEVPPGMYELIALPLKLVGFDASPVRAVLRTLD
ncbi:MAG: cyclase family protein [Planctomycetes bacterium]|nr:cyclase family protein [Planctomycetota bacterium]